MEQALEQMAALVAKPISPEAPAGSWVRYQPEFEDLKQQIDKITGFNAHEVDWTRVISVAGSILETKSKDLLVASYMVAGLQAKQGARGLAEGLASVSGMCRSFWDSLYPETKRMRARIQALEWLVERLSGEIKKMTPKPADAEDIGKALASLEELDTFLAEKLVDEAPSLSELTRAIEDLKERAEEAAQAKAAPQAAVRTVPPGAGASAAPRPSPAPAAESFDLSTPEGVEKALDKALSTLREIAGGIRKLRPQDAAAYRLTRLAAWLPLSELPSNNEGTTRIPPMGSGPQLTARLDELAAGKSWSELLDQAEYQFGKSVFWLDAQRYVSQALQESGSDFAEALEAVRQECRVLLRRFPEIAELNFSNGTPFADDATRAWLRDLAQSSQAGGDTAPAKSRQAPAAAGSDVDEELQAALKKIGTPSARNLPEAAKILGELAEGARDPRRRFLRRLALARWLAKSSDPRLAVAHLDRLEEAIRRHGLEEWDPGLAAEVLGLLVSCYRQLLSGPWKNLDGAGEKAEQLFLRLARLDASAAIGQGPR